MIGPPQVYPQHGDIHGAWATSVCDKNQFIEVLYIENMKPPLILFYLKLNYFKCLILYLLS